MKKTIVILSIALISASSIAQTTQGKQFHYTQYYCDSMLPHNQMKQTYYHGDGTVTLTPTQIIRQNDSTVVARKGNCFCNYHLKKK